MVFSSISPTWRAAVGSITLFLVALSAGMAFCHLMESPARLDYDPALWVRVTVQEGTYDTFGPPLGASIEGLAWVMAVVHAILSWGTRRFTPVGAAAGLMVLAQAIWWVWVNPANAAMSEWTPNSIGEAFEAIRFQWEYAHSARAVLQITALSLLVVSAVHGNRAMHERERAG